MRLPDWLVPAATGVAGLAAGLLINIHSSAPDPAAFEINPVIALAGGDADPAVTQATAAVTLDDLRRVVREELAAVRTETPASVTADTFLEGSVATSVAEQEAAATQARAVLDSALARRTWTDADRESLSPQVALMSPAQREQWLQQYAQAVNQGRLVPASELPPF